MQLLISVALTALFTLSTLSLSSAAMLRVLDNPHLPEFSTPPHAIKSTLNQILRGANDSDRRDALLVKASPNYD